MNRHIFSAIGAATLAASPLLAQPVPDETLDRAWAQFDSVWVDWRDGEATAQDFMSAYDEAIAPLPFERFSSSQIAGLPFMVFQFGDGMERGLTRLDAILADDPDDLHALIRYVDLLCWSRAIGYDKPIDNSRERVRALLDQIAEHPEFADAVRDGTARWLPNWIGYYGPEPDGLSSQRRILDRLIEHLDREPEPNPLSIAIGKRWTQIKDLGYDLGRLNEHRARLLPRVQAGLLTLENAEAPGQVERAGIFDAEQAIGLMTSANAVRDIIGAEAPALDFVWSSDPSLASMDDLRGRPVLLEFWVTGCGHCIRAIPRMQELADRYRHTELLIVAVTSVQGRHFDPATRQQIDASGDPEREFELMAGFIESQGVTWPVVFTEQTAWNPDYEVRGTPHFTLIDPDGRVVANDMHPYDGLAKNSARIDAMLEEHGIETPPPLSEDG